MAFGTAAKCLNFVDGVYETADPREIGLLKKVGCRHDGEKPIVKAEANHQTDSTTVYEQMTVAQLKERAATLGIEIPKSARKDEIIAAIEEAEAKCTQQSSMQTNI